jgi:hypothetical protein
MIRQEEHNQLMADLKAEYEKTIKAMTREVIRLPELQHEAYLMGELDYNEVRDIYAYIDQVGFEVIGNVNLYDPNTGESRKVTSYEYNGTDPTVKKLTWFSEDQLLLIVGFATGTVTVGGSVYALSIETGELIEIILPGDMEEIIDIVKPDGGSGDLIFVVAKWDNQYMEYETYNVVYDHTELSEIIETKDAIELSKQE